MSHKMLRPFVVKVSVLGYFPLRNKLNIKKDTSLYIFYKINKIMYSLAINFQ